jgi:hypothetical protein
VHGEQRGEAAVAALRPVHSAAWVIQLAPLLKPLWAPIEASTVSTI